MEVKTEKQLLIELRDSIALRRISFLANVKYFEVMAKKAKANTQAKVDAMNQVGANGREAKKDRVFLEVLDKMLSELN